MSEFSGLWSAPSGAGDGASSFTRSDWSLICKVLGACMDDEGEAYGLLNSLTGTVTGTNTASINTGGALVDGKPYYNSAAVAVNIPSAAGGGNTRIDRVVLRADWAAQTVRITRIAGVDAASPAAPTITQVSGTTYDIKLYQALVNTSGTVTLIEERVYAIPGTDTINTAAIQALAVTTGKIALLAVGTSQLALNSVDDTIAGNRVPQFYRRQGNNASNNWDQIGTDSIVPTAIRMQAGAAQVSSGGGLAITFPTSFSQTPLVIANVAGAVGFCTIDLISATQCTISAWNTTPARMTAIVYWLAFGSE